MATGREAELRESAIAELRHATEQRSFFTRDELMGFTLPTGRLPMVDLGRGIRNPAGWDATLAVVSTPDGPYDDVWHDDATLVYKYRINRDGSSHSDNNKMRTAMDLGVPIVLFRRPEHNLYIPIFDVFVVGDDPLRQEFTLSLVNGTRPSERVSEVERRYRDQLVRTRVHQPLFRGMIMRAYGRACAVCSLKHGELLDAAHIIEDGHADGHASVPNGLSLCKIHHAAYDQDLLGITPDFSVAINEALLNETDGPMLRHGLQEMHDRPLALPARKIDRPDPERLDVRYQRFLAHR